MTRAEARKRIIDEANAQARATRGRDVQPYNSRSIQQAVRVCRANKLVPRRVYVTAGFKA